MIRRHVSALLLVFSLLNGCACHDGTTDAIDYREEMRTFVVEISEYGKRLTPSFSVITQNGQELATDTGDPDGAIRRDYIMAMDGTGREDLFFGYVEDDRPTPETERDYMIGLCDILQSNGVAVLAIDYCTTEGNVDLSYSANESRGYISFAADRRELNSIPDYPAQPYNRNSDSIDDITKAKNFLYLINTANYTSKQGFLDDVSRLDYDIVILDLFHDEEAYTSSEIQSLKSKASGGRRLVFCYMSIGEAEDYRYYWKAEWLSDKPAWLEEENPDWEGNFKVRYWNAEWKGIIYGSSDSYLDRIIAAGFDGVYLDIIDAFEYFEE